MSAGGLYHPAAVAATHNALWICFSGLKPSLPEEDELIDGAAEPAPAGARPCARRGPCYNSGAFQGSVGGNHGQGILDRLLSLDL